MKHILGTEGLTNVAMHSKRDRKRLVFINLNMQTGFTYRLESV